MKNSFSYNKSKKEFIFTGDLNLVLENAKRNLDKLKKELTFET